ncbi:MAG: hypothetical protein HY791_01920 [Deltaproteobacteria bacterium]|nr:hypothetical protein [Deltaproteobacteria bacterium]
MGFTNELMALPELARLLERTSGFSAEAEAITSRVKLRELAEPYTAAMCFLARSAATLEGDAATDLLLRTLQAAERFAGTFESPLASLTRGVTGVLSSGQVPLGFAKRWASHDSEEVRRAVALSLQVTSPEASTILDRLARDSAPEVRAAAQRRLKASQEVPWWFGKFSSDPAVRLGTEVSETLKSTLARLSALLDGYTTDDASALGELARVLPDDLLADLTITLVGRSRHSLDYPELVSVLLDRPALSGRFIELVEAFARSDKNSANRQLGALAATKSESSRTELFWALVRAASTQPRSARAELFSPASSLMRIAGEIYPPLANLEPLLDFVLNWSSSDSAEASQSDLAISCVTPLFGKSKEGASSVRSRFLQARLEGFKGGWRPLANVSSQVFSGGTNEELRPFAEAALSSADDGTVRWGLLTLFRAYDPERDPPGPVLARALFSDPRFRPLLLDPALVDFVVSMAREALLAQELELESACKVVGSIERVYGSGDPKPSPFFVPAQPMSQAEWRAFRAIRDRSQPSAKALKCIERQSDGQWAPEDRRFLEVCFGAVGPENWIAFSIGEALLENPPPDFADLFGRIFTANTAAFHRHWRRQGKEVLTKLGLDPDLAGSWSSFSSVEDDD